MINKIFSGVSSTSEYLFTRWKYFLLQEKCRLCNRMIHPFIENMELNLYAPPANYFMEGKTFLSDVICQFCSDRLNDCQAVVNKHFFEITLDNISKNKEITIASGSVFAEPVQDLIHRLKYSDDVLLALDLAFLMYRAWHLLQIEMDWDEEESLCFIPVPLHKKRLYERGFNQAEILAKHLARIVRVPISNNLLIREKNTLSQQKLSKINRAKNVKGAFSASKEDMLSGKQVILIDDVCTSGATLTECAKAALIGGAHSVCAITVAFVL